MHAGLLQLSCADCRDNEYLKSDWGCNEPTKLPIWDDGEGNEYYSCPLHWVTENIIGWYEDYSYCVEFGGPPIGDRTMAWVEAWHLYKSKYNSYVKQVMDSKRSKTDLSSFKPPE